MSEQKNENPMMCDPVTGICEVPGGATAVQEPEVSSGKKPVKVLYFTDPICSSCWGIEPQLRRLKMEYGDFIDIEYRMGGLLKSWDSYGGSDVSGPKSVAQHWDEAGAHYDMPIDGSVWLEDPLDSSYPPSIAYKAAQLQGEKKASDFLRRIREMVFIEKKNIARWEHLEEAAGESGLDVATFKADYEGRAKELFEEDLSLSRGMGVRGFPTIYFLDDEGNRLLVYGSRPYDSYESSLLRLYPDAKKKESDISHEELFETYPTMTFREFSELTDTQAEEAKTILTKLVGEGKITATTFKKSEVAIYKKKA